MARKKTAPAKKRTLPKAAEATKFKKGQRPGPGRAKGTPNKMGRQIKEAIITALEMSGRDGKGKDGAAGYFVWLSRNEPAVFGNLVGKVIPMQVDVKDKTERYTPQEAVERLRERGLPVPPSLTSLAGSVGRAVVIRAEEDYEAELNGEEPEESDDDEQDEAA